MILKALPQELLSETLKYPLLDNEVAVVLEKFFLITRIFSSVNSNERKYLHFLSFFNDIIEVRI